VLFSLSFDGVARVLRSALPEHGVFHVVSRGVSESAIYRDDADRKTFLTILGSVVVKWDWSCHAYCLMTTHYHAIVEAEQRHLSRGMHMLNGRYARYFNERHNRHGHLFGDRYGVYVIEEDEHLEASCHYVLDNPIRAGLCATREDWPWSALVSGSGTRPWPGARP